MDKAQLHAAAANLACDGIIKLINKNVNVVITLRSATSLLPPSMDTDVDGNIFESVYYISYSSVISEKKTVYGSPLNAASEIILHAIDTSSTIG